MPRVRSSSSVPQASCHLKMTMFAAFSTSVSSLLSSRSHALSSSQGAFSRKFFLIISVPQESFARSPVASTTLRTQYSSSKLHISWPALNGPCPTCSDDWSLGPSLPRQNSAPTNGIILATHRYPNTRCRLCHYYIVDDSHSFPRPTLLRFDSHALCHPYL